MKKLLCLFLTGMILVGLCGCNGSHPVGTDTEESSGSEVIQKDNSETNSSQVTEQKEGLAFSVQYIRTNGYVDGARFPRVVVIRSTAELKDYYNQNYETFDLERKKKVYSDTTIGFLDACDKYTDTYFEKKMLVMVLVEHGSGSIRDKVTKVESAVGGSLQVSIEQIVPEILTDDMAEWHILIELENDIDITAEDVVIN